MKLQKLLVQSLLWRGFYFLSVLLVNIFLSRYLQAAATGWIFYLSNIFGLIQLLLSFSLDAGMTFFSAGKIIPDNKLVSFNVLWSMAAALIAFAMLYVLFFYGYPVSSSERRTYIFFGLCYVSGVMLTNIGTALFYTKENFFLPNIIMVSLNIIFLFIIPKSGVAYSSITANKILDIYFLIFLLQGIFILFVFAFTSKAVQTLQMPASYEIKRIVKYSAVALAANIIFFLEYRIDYWFVHQSPVCTDADLGNYIQVSKLGQMMLIVPQIIASVIYPQSAASINRKELNEALMTISRLFSQLYLLLFLVVLFTGHSLFTAVFGETFNKMQTPFLIIIPGIFSLSVLCLLSAYFSGKGNLAVNVRGASFALIVMVVADYFLVPSYGIVAAATVSTISYTVNLAYSLRQFYKDYSISLVDFFKWRKDDYAWLTGLLRGGNAL